MKNVLRVIPMLALTLMFSCKKDNNLTTSPTKICPSLKTAEVNSTVQEAFSKKYPENEVIQWYDKDGKMVVAYFADEKGEKLAWFDPNGRFLKCQEDDDDDGDYEDFDDGEDEDDHHDFDGCNDFTHEELMALASECLNSWIEENYEIADWIEQEILELENYEPNGNCDMTEEEIAEEIEELHAEIEELEEEQAELQDMLANLEGDECGDEDLLCEIVWECMEDEEGGCHDEDDEDDDNDNDDDNDDDDDEDDDDDDGCTCVTG